MTGQENRASNVGVSTAVLLFCSVPPKRPNSVQHFESANMSEYHIITQRLGLRNWIDDDIAPFVAMCQDDEVMKHFPRKPTETEAIASIRRSQAHFEEHGFTYFAVEELSSNEFIGFVGLKNQTYESPFTPCVDIGWRLRRSSWGKGYATEAARACIDYAFSCLCLDSVLAVCAHTNTGSEAVMKRIGMTQIGSFKHSEIESDSPLNPCLAYQIKNPRISG